MYGKTLRFIYAILYCILLFFFVYDCYFMHFTYTTNILIAYMGLMVFPFWIYKHDIIKDNSISCFILFIIMIVYSFFVMFINKSRDMTFFRNELLRNVFFPFFSSFFVVWIGDNFRVSFNKVCNYIVSLSVVQCIIILICFFNREFKETIISIQFISQRELSILDAGIRSVGLGTRFDFGAFTMSYLMLISIYLYLTTKDSKKNKFLWIWVLQLVAGMFLARSIVLGVLASILMLLFSSNSIVAKAKSSFKIIAIIFSSIITVLFLFPTIVERYTKTFNWMFQYFNNNSESYAVDTLSKLSDDMYFFPQLSTLIIGDGIFTTSNGYAYMSTDPLIMRYILFWGCPGLIIFILFTAKLYRWLDVNTNSDDNFEHKLDHSLFLKVAFILHIIIYFKLNYHMFKFVYLFIWILVFRKKKSEFADNAIYQ